MLEDWELPETFFSHCSLLADVINRLQYNTVKYYNVLRAICCTRRFDSIKLWIGDVKKNVSSCLLKYLY